MARRNIDSIPACSNCFEFSPIFGHLKKDDLSILTFEKGCDFYKRGSVVYKERSRISGVFCVNKGIVKLYKTGVDDREKIIRFAQKGDIIGYRSILTEDLACTSVKVIKDAVLCFIPATIFTNLIRTNPDFSLAILKLALKELGEANKFIIDMAQKTVRERLAEVLILLKDTFGLDDNNFLNICLTREELANMVGTATESVIRLLSEFRADLYIELEGRKIKLQDVDSLKKMARV